MPRLDFPWDLQRGVGHRDEKAAPHFPRDSVYIWKFVGGSPHKCPEGLLLGLVVSLFPARPFSCLIEPKWLKISFLRVILILLGIIFP